MWSAGYDRPHRIFALGGLRRALHRLHGQLQHRGTLPFAELRHQHKRSIGKFGQIDPDVPHRHHDAIEFPDGSNVLVTQLCEGQRVTVLQLPVVQQAAEHAQPAARTPTRASAPVD